MVKMSVWEDTRDSFINTVNEDGTSIRIKHYTGSRAVASYDDVLALTPSGTDVWTSGLIFPVKATRGSQEAVLIEQGKILTSDKTLFIPGNIETTETMKIGLGSPVANEYSIVPVGVLAYPPEGDIVYKKMYVSRLQNGSLIGE